MIYLAHSKAPSNETSSRRTQNSASSSIERTFRHSILRNQTRQFLFSLDQPSSVSTTSTPHARRRTIVNHSISNAKFSETQESPDWRVAAPAVLAGPKSKSNKIEHFQRNTWSIVKNSKHTWKRHTFTITIIITSKKIKRRRYFHPHSQY